MHYAVGTADEDMVQVLLHWNADIAVEDGNKQTALQRAERSRMSGIARLLKDRAVDVVSPLLSTDEVELESRKARELIRRHMVENIGDAGLRGKAGEEELLKAVTRGDLDTTLVLLDLGVNKNAFNPRTGTVLQQAVRGVDWDIVKALLAAGCDMDGDKNQLLGLERIFMPHFMVDYSDSFQPFNPDNLSALLTTAYAGKNEMAKILLAAGADVNQQHCGQTALLLASYYGHYDLVETLLTASVNVDRESAGYTSLLVAVQRGHGLIVQALLTAGAYIEHQRAGYTALLLAAEHGHERIIDALLTAGANIEHALRGYTALLIASMKGHNGAVQRLLAAGANSEAEVHGRTALYLAASHGHAEIVQTLVTAGANIDAQADGKSALKRAARAGNIEIVKILREAGALGTTSLIMKSARKQLGLGE